MLIMKDEMTITYTGKSNAPPFEEVIVEWHDILGGNIPNINWTQVHAIANYQGKVVVVSKTKHGHTMVHVPGGHVEEGEDVETTLHREILEETGGTLVNWKPLGYQKRTDSKGHETYQLRVYAEIKDIKSTTTDFDGLTSETKLIDISDMLDVLEWNNPIGRQIFELVSGEFSDN